MNVTTKETEENCDLDLAESSDLALIICWATLVLVVGGVVGCFLVFLRHRRNSLFLQRRQASLIGIYGISLMLLAVTTMLRGIIGASSYPCILFVVARVLIFSGVFLSTMLRVISFHFQHRRNIFIADQMSKRANVSYYGDGKRSLESQSQASSSDFTLAKLKAYALPDAQRQLNYLTYLSGRRFQQHFLVLNLIGSLIFFASFAIDENGLYCVGCQPERTEFFRGIFGILLPLVLASLFLFHKVRDEPDFFLIKSEVGTTLLVYFSSFVIWLFFALNDFGDLDENGDIQWSVIFLFGLLLGFANMTLYQVFVVAPRQEANLSKADGLNIDMVFRNKTCLKLYKKHLLDEMAYENYLFYAAMLQWNETYDSLGEELRQEASNVIRHNFIDVGSKFEINLSHSQREDMLNMLNAGDISKEVFQPAFKEIRSLMSHDSIPRFACSRAYKEWKTNEPLASFNITI